MPDLVANSNYQGMDAGALLNNWQSLNKYLGKFERDEKQLYVNEKYHTKVCPLRSQVHDRYSFLKVGGNNVANRNYTALVKWLQSPRHLARKRDFSCQMQDSNLLYLVV